VGHSAIPERAIGETRCISTYMVDGMEYVNAYGPAAAAERTTSTGSPALAWPNLNDLGNPRRGEGRGPFRRASRRSALGVTAQKHAADVPGWTERYKRCRLRSVKPVSPNRTVWRAASALRARTTRTCFRYSWRIGTQNRSGRDEGAPIAAFGRNQSPDDSFASVPPKDRPKSAS
jgi:hypothetical protein